MVNYGENISMTILAVGYVCKMSSKDVRERLVASLNLETRSPEVMTARQDDCQSLFVGD